MAKFSVTYDDGETVEVHAPDESAAKKHANLIAQGKKQATKAEKVKD
jgi:hypothetical protein